jgi:peptidyl-dipeptidase Dcp
VSKVFFNLTESNTNDTIQAVQADVAPKLAAHQDNILLDPALFARIEALQAASATLDAEQQRLVERWHKAFVRAGARLSDADKAAIRKLNEEQSTLVTRFQENLLKATNAGAVVVDDVARLAGLSDAQISAAAEAAKARALDGKWLLTLQNTTRQPVTAALSDRALRQAVWEASANRGMGGDADNGAIVIRLAALRAERAKLLGYPDWASYALDDQMAKTPDAVLAMLTELAPKVVANARAEAAEIQKLIDAEGGGYTVAPWDWDYYAEQVRAARYALDDAAIKPYFELERVLVDGVFFAMNRQYGISFRERKDLPVYHPDVRVFDVLDADGSQLGLFYADYYARDAKRGGAWMDTFVDQSGLMGTKPVVVNVLNIAKPAAGQPTLLSFDEVTTLFHEMGHAVHGLFSDVRYPLLSGTNVPRDFVEFPSQFQEDWALDPAVLANYAKHWQSGEPIPAELITKIIDARGFNQGFDTLEYVGASLLDLAWHQLPAGETVTDVQAFEDAVRAKYSIDFAPVPPRYRSTYFAHVFPGGYSAGYYAYLWSEVLAADAFAYMGSQGGLTRDNGARFRDAILSRGGTKEAMQLYVDWRGAEPGTEAFLARRGIR